MSASSQRGFTLIEVLLATVLSAMVALAVASLLSTQFSARKRMRERADQRSLLGAIERRVRADIESLVPPGGLYASGVIGEDSVASGGGESLLSDELATLATSTLMPSGDPIPIGERDQLTLAVWPAAGAFGVEVPTGEGALLQVVYRIDDDPETEERGLVRVVQRVRDLTSGTEPAPPEELAPEVVALQVSFFDGEAWQTTWDSGGSDTLPNSIALDLVVAREPDGPGKRGKLLTYRIEVSPLTARPSRRPEPTR
ncbi:MAG: prepilin-type N-terminal cleavage/methylation domain-containing protein [Planctomycetes bacterium]|nr:prepilin-type N-terminal cleavage/methylation domain-containing protein [Planctomycetota bacterium]